MQSIKELYNSLYVSHLNLCAFIVLHFPFIYVINLHYIVIFCLSSLLSFNKILKVKMSHIFTNIVTISSVAYSFV
jgi:hypothetical protein